MRPSDITRTDQSLLLAVRRFFCFPRDDLRQPFRTDPAGTFRWAVRSYSDTENGVMTLLPPIAHGCARLAESPGQRANRRCGASDATRPPETRPTHFLRSPFRWILPLPKAVLMMRSLAFPSASGAIRPAGGAFRREHG